MLISTAQNMFITH